MPLEARKTSIVYNGVSVPGIDRNGAFIAEAPVQTFILYRTGTIASSGSRPFTVEFPSLPRTALIADSTNSTSYVFEITTPEGFLWSYTFSGTSVGSFGATKVLTFPEFVIDKGSRVTVKPSGTIQSLVLFALPAYNLDVKDF